MYTAALLLLAAFPWGPLFAWSPVHPGYQDAQFGRADVLYPKGGALDPAYGQIDRYVAMAESFHELRCPKRIRVVVCRTWSDYFRFMPYTGAARPLASTIFTGTAIFVTPRAAGDMDIGGLLRHELSHAVLSQNRSALSVLRMLREPWVNEGVAGVVAAMEPPLPGRELVTLPQPRFLDRARTEELWPTFADPAQKDWRFSYTAWMYFWDRQIEKAGKPAYLRFERACFADPRDCRAAFAGVYGTDLHTAVSTLQAEVQSGRLAPLYTTR